MNLEGVHNVLTGLASVILAVAALVTAFKAQKKRGDPIEKNDEII